MPLDLKVEGGKKSKDNQLSIRALEARKRHLSNYLIYVIRVAKNDPRFLFERSWGHFLFKAPPADMAGMKDFPVFVKGRRLFLNSTRQMDEFLKNSTWRT
jgi:hypothetical protein